MLIGDKMIIAKSKYRKFPMTSSVSQGLRPHAWPFFILKSISPRTMSSTAVMLTPGFTMFRTQPLLVWSSSSLRCIETPEDEIMVPERPAQIQTIFRGPKAREIKLTNEFKQDKGHGWLEKKRKNDGL